MNRDRLSIAVVAIGCALLGGFLIASQREFEDRLVRSVRSCELAHFGGDAEAIQGQLKRQRAEITQLQGYALRLDRRLGELGRCYERLHTQVRVESDDARIPQMQGNVADHEQRLQQLESPNQ